MSSAKRFLCVWTLLFLVFAVSPLIAQESAGGAFGKFKNESEFYYVNVPIERVYPHQLGYLVMYRFGDGLKRAYLPHTWFSKAAGKAQLVRISSGNVWPYLVVYYRNKEFSHAVLYVHSNFGHESWGTIPAHSDLSRHFDTEELHVP